MTSNDRHKLTKIYRLIYRKLTEIQIDDKFVKSLEKVKNITYTGKSDNHFFQTMADLIFQSGVRGAIWKKYEPEIKKEFGDYKVKKVANYTEKDLERMLTNPNMFKHCKKIEACIHNAKVIMSISESYNGFWHWLDSRKVEELVEKLKSNFKWMGLINAYAFLRYAGMEVIKPDLNVRRVFFRLGFLTSMAVTPKTYKQIQEVGKEIAEENNVRMTVVDYTLYMFGSGEKPFVKYAICGKAPKCGECPVKNSCHYFIEVVSNR